MKRKIIISIVTKNIKKYIRELFLTVTCEYLGIIELDTVKQMNERQFRNYTCNNLKIRTNLSIKNKFIDFN